MISKALEERRERKNGVEGVKQDEDEAAGGDVVDLDAEVAETVQTFAGANTLLTSHEHGWPRGAEVVAGRQLGQTPIMELVKAVIASQLTGGELALPFVEEDDEMDEATEAFRDALETLLQRNHVNMMEWDDLVDAAVSDIVDTGWAYWEQISSADGRVPVLQLKPVDALTIQHNLNDQGQFRDDGPRFYHAPAAASAAGSIQPIELSGDPTPLDAEQIVAMRGPGVGRPNDPYGQAPAVKAREWLEVYSNSTADINRDYDDTQIPEGIFQVDGGQVDDLGRQLRQSRGDKRKAPVVDYEVDWLDVGFDTTDTRIAEQEWFLRMLMAMFGINRNELGMTDGTGLGTETPAQATLIYKKITLPFMQTFTSAIRTQTLPQFDGYDGQFGVEIRGVDPRQEVVEHEEARKRFTEGSLTYAEMKDLLGEDVPDDTVLEVGGDVIDWAGLPRWVVEQRIRVELNELGQESAAVEGESWTGETEGPPDPDAHPVLSESEAAARLGYEGDLGLLRRQLDEVIEIQSSFIESTAYFRPSNFMQITFNPEGYAPSTYWYADVPERLFFEFLRATSKGQFFNVHIRHTGQNDFPYVRVD